MAVVKPWGEAAMNMRLARHWSDKHYMAAQLGKARRRGGRRREEPQKREVGTWRSSL